MTASAFAAGPACGLQRHAQGRRRRSAVDDNCECALRCSPARRFFAWSVAASRPDIAVSGLRHVGFTVFLVRPVDPAISVKPRRCSAARRRCCGRIRGRAARLGRRAWNPARGHRLPRTCAKVCRSPDCRRPLPPVRSSTVAFGMAATASARPTWRGRRNSSKFAPSHQTIGVIACDGGRSGIGRTASHSTARTKEATKVPVAP